MPQLTIDCAAVEQNFRTIQKAVGHNCEVAPVVKANAYGCGVATIASFLEKAGAKTFFVATLVEALELRTIIEQQSVVATLNGFETEYAHFYAQESVTPVLSTLEHVKDYRSGGEEIPAPIVHIDTGMNRLGISVQEAQNIEGLSPSIVMSHFASADDQDAPLTARQYERFRQVTKLFPDARHSLASSSGIFRSDEYHLDMVRPGMSLYGLNPTPEKENPMRPVVSLDAPILQIRKVKKDETCGYNETYRFKENTKLAIVPIGYADGFLRSLSNTGTLYWKGFACPLRGRVSMDLSIVDLCNVPEDEMPSAGDRLEVIGPHQSADDLAKAAGTIGYEILTSLSRRYKRVYKD